MVPSFQSAGAAAGTGAGAGAGSTEQNIPSCRWMWPLGLDWVSYMPLRLFKSGSAPDATASGATSGAASGAASGAGATSSAAAGAATAGATAKDTDTDSVWDEAEEDTYLTTVAFPRAAFDDWLPSDFVRNLLSCDPSISNFMDVSSDCWTIRAAITLVSRAKGPDVVYSQLVAPTALNSAEATAAFCKRAAQFSETDRNRRVEPEPAQMSAQMSAHGAAEVEVDRAILSLPIIPFPRVSIHTEVPGMCLTVWVYQETQKTGVDEDMDSALDSALEAVLEEVQPKKQGFLAKGVMGLTRANLAKYIRELDDQLTKCVTAAFDCDLLSSNSDRL